LEDVGFLSLFFHHCCLAFPHLVVTAQPATIHAIENGLLTMFILATDGFFDAGMLLQALKARHENPDAPDKAPPRRRDVGKKLRLIDY
jgi:hypothetical protein